MLNNLFRRRPLIEELEPRILFSADLAPFALDNFSPVPEQRTIQSDGEFSSVAATTRNELVIVDTSVADYQMLLTDILKQAGTDRHISVVILDANRDGITQISDALKQYDNLDAVHLISHGSAGMLQLGSSQLNATSLANRAADIAAWGSAFTAEGDLLLYGCNVAADTAGQAFLNTLSRLTSTDVAASTDLTGTTEFGGNWQLEFGIGRIENAMLIDANSQPAWAGTLAVAFTSVSSGDLSSAVTTYNFSHNVNSGTDRLLLVELVIANGVNATAVDFNGTALTFHSAQNSPSGHVRVELWSLVAPTEVSGTVNITLASAATLIAGATSYSGVDQATPLGNVSTTSGNSTTPSATVVTSTGDMVVDIVGATSVSSNTINASQMQNFSRNQGNGATDLFAVSSREIGAASVPMDHSFTSTDTNWAMIAVEINRSSAVNTAPVLDSSKTPTLPAIPEGDPAPVGAVGVLVSTLIDYATPSGEVDNVTDPDGDQLGIAVTGVIGAGNGSWFYSTNDGGTWNPMGPVSNNSARLLFADGMTRVYFQPSANTNGTLNNVITFRAWDRSSGYNGQDLVNTSGANNGGSTALSTDTDTVNLTVTAVNDAPVNAVPDPQFTAKNTTLVFSTANGNAFSISDVDAGNAIMLTTLTVSSGLLNAGAGTTGVSVTGSGTGTVTLTGTIAQIINLLAGNLGSTLSFAPTTNFTGSVTLTFTTNDQNAGASGSGGAKSDTNVVTISVTDAALWLSTEGNATSSAGSGNLSWQDSRVVNFGNPNLSLGSGTTGGTFSIAFNMNTLSGDGNVDVKGLHVVGRAVTVGASVPVNLLVGDVLFSVEGNETFGGVAVTKKDVVLFRPTTYGDYSSGSFSVLLRAPGGTGDDIRDFALVETAITVGGTPLQAGDFLLLLSGGSRDKDVWHFRADAAGAATTGAAPTELVNGDAAGLNIGARLVGIELITQPVTIGGQSLNAGRLLLSLDGSAVIGGLSVQAGDVLALNLLTSGNLSTGTASMLMRASDVGLTGGGETLDALALVQRASSPPVVTVDAAVLTYTENDPATLIAPSANVNDADSANFGSGSLSVYLSNNGTANDRLAIRHQGNAAGQIGLSGSDVLYGGTIIGSFSGGEDGSTPLVISLNANATVNATQALLRNITYANMSDDPSTSPRTLSVVLTDGNGGVSNMAARTINVTAVNDLPAPAAASATGAEDTPFSITLSGSDIDGSIASFTVTALPLQVTLYTDAARTMAVAANTAYAASSNVLTLYVEPDANWNGATSFSYLATDNLGLQSTTTAILTATSVNDAPTISGITATTNIDDTATATPFSAVVIGDVDSPTQMQTLSITLDTAAKGGLSNLGGGSYNADTGVYSFSGTAADATTAVQSLAFTPTANRVTPGSNETTSFTISVSDGVAAAVTNNATTVVTISVNDAPVAVADTAVAVEAGGIANGTAGTDPTGNVLVNDTDVDGGESKTVTSFTFGPAPGTLGSPLSGNYGALTLNANGSYSYVVDNSNPAVQALRASSTPLVEVFDYTMQDGANASSSSTLTITIDGVNDAPTTSPVTLTPIAEDSGGRLITQAELLANANDVDGDILTAIGLTISSGNGALVDNLNGSWTYSPALNDDTSVSFSYNITDGAITISGSATLDITPVNDVPVITSSSVHHTQEEKSASTSVTATDIENEKLSFSITGGADAALFTIDPDTGLLSLTFIPNFEAPLDANGDNIYEVIVTVSDASGDSSSLAIQQVVTDKAGASIPLPGSPATPTDSSTTTENETDGETPLPIPLAQASQSIRDVLATDEVEAEVSIVYQNAASGSSAQMFFKDSLLNRNAAPSATLLATLNQALGSLVSDARALQMLQTSFENSSFQQQLDQLQESIRQQLNLDKNTIASTLAVSTGLSVGYVLWLVRGGVLLSSLLTSMPAWRLIDPLPILGHLGTRKHSDDEDDSLEGMLKKSNSRTEPTLKDTDEVTS